MFHCILNYLVERYFGLKILFRKYMQFWLAQALLYSLHFLALSSKGTCKNFICDLFFQNCFETDYADCTCMLSRDPNRKMFVTNIINKRSILSSTVGTLIGLLSTLGGYYMFLKYCSGITSSWTPSKWPKRIIPSEYQTRWPRPYEGNMASGPGATNIYRTSNESFQFKKHDYHNRGDW